MNVKDYFRSPSFQTTGVVAVLFYAACFVYISWRLDPSLYYQCQVPIFICDGLFFSNFLHYPGGMAEYVSNFLSQLYYFPFVGTLIVSACLVSIHALSVLILKHFAPTLKLGILHYIPTFLLLILHSQYEHRLTFTLCLLASVSLFYLYLRLRPSRFIVRTVLFFIQAIVIYPFSAGFVLFFSTFCLLCEIFYYRSCRY